MTETIEKKMCDICHKEVKYFSGSLVLDYSDTDCSIYTGYGYPVRIEQREICLNCCRRLYDVLTGAIKEM